MTEDTEKRFQRIMDKLYRSPKPKPPPPSGGGGTSTQQKGRWREVGAREEAENSTRHVGAAIGAREGGLPPCRPWDRGDLMRRLATFKAMTWFGKPKAIDPVNCARRGWVNVEMDTLACDACGARLLFSTPSSWTLQQVEKAAAVFSLKLDGGHKLLCPWIDNICDEALAFFPPTPPPVLIEGYKERSAALLQLSALPVISLSAIDYMRSPQLEDFLAKSSTVAYELEGGMKLTVSSGSVVLDSASAADTASQYYQAHKIISLCGWQPRVLPYVVDCEGHSSHSMEKDKAVDSSSEILCNQNPSFIVYASMVPRESDGVRNDQPSLGDQYDPSSVVLDCKLCGACVGLWAFVTVSRPLELFNLTESPEDGQSGPGTGSDGSTSNEKPLSLNLTIAGGPPPTKQNFKPRISLPIVTRHLRSAFASNGGIRNDVSADAQGMDQLNTRSFFEFQVANVSNNLPFSSETSGMLKRKRNENEYFTQEGSIDDIQPHLNGNADVGGDTLSNDQRTGDLSSTPQSEKGLLHEETSEQLSAEANKCLQNANEDLVQHTMVTKDAENGRSTNPEVGHDVNLQPGDTTCIDIDSSLCTDGEACENSSSIGITGICRQDNSGFPGMDMSSHGNSSQVNREPQNIASDAFPENQIISVEVNENLSSKDDTHGGGGNEMQSHTDESVDNQTVPTQKSKTLNSVDTEVVTVCTSRYNPSSFSHWDNTNKFDPIRQHRPFCPWIAPMHDENMPGWKLTLRALVQDKRSPRVEGPSSFSDEVDDPIVSVRKLFTSPPSKRFKGAG